MDGSFCSLSLFVCNTNAKQWQWMYIPIGQENANGPVLWSTTLSQVCSALPLLSCFSAFSGLVWQRLRTVRPKRLPWWSWQWEKAANFLWAIEGLSLLSLSSTFTRTNEANSAASQSSSWRWRNTWYPNLVSGELTLKAPGRARKDEDKDEEVGLSWFSTIRTWHYKGMRIQWNVLSLTSAVSSLLFLQGEKTNPILWFVDVNPSSDVRPTEASR